MILVLILLPLVIYYLVFVPLIMWIFKRICKLKRRILLIILVLFPIGDHILGYAYFKSLCFIQPAIKINRTVTDTQEQKDYWFLRGGLKSVSSSYYQHDKIHTYRLNHTDYFSSDFSQVYNVYYAKFSPNDNLEERIKIEKNIKKVFEKKKKSEFSILMTEKELSENSERLKKIPKYLKKRFKNDKYYFVEDSSIVASLNVIKKSEDKATIERGYENYCNNSFNDFSLNSDKYKKSCAYSDKIIKKYNLQNVIKVPKSPYIEIIQNDKNELLKITYETFSLINKNTSEILAIKTERIFWGGWYLNFIGSQFHNSGLTCNDVTNYYFREKIIPNPYKKDNK